MINVIGGIGMNRINNKSVMKAVARIAQILDHKGQFTRADRLRMILESHNRCLICGERQEYDPEYHSRTGLWKCPKCD